MADLPVTIRFRSLDGLINFWAIERGKGDHCPAANSCAIPGGCQDCRESSWVSQGTQGSNCGLPAQGVLVVGGKFDEAIQRGRGSGWSLSARPGRGLDHDEVLVEEQETECLTHFDRQRIIHAAVPPGGFLAGTSSHRGVGVAEGREQFSDLELSEAVEGPQGCGPHLRVDTVEQSSSGVDVAGVACDRGKTALCDRLRGSTRHWECRLGHAAFSHSDPHDGDCWCLGRGRLRGFVRSGVSVSDIDDPQPVVGEPAQTRAVTPRRRLRIVLWVLGAFSVALVAAALFIRLPYYTLSPGSSRATEPLIAVENAQTYENDGVVDFLTVSLRQATAVELLIAWVDSSIEVESKDDLFGKKSENENREINVRMMSDSKDSATYQALTRLGYTIPSSGTGAVVASVQSDGPTADVLSPGEVIIAVDDVPITMNSQLVTLVGASKPGEVRQLSVQRYDGTSDHVVAVTIGARPDDPSRGYLGVSTFTRDLSFDFPVTVTINSGSVSGPSAGLAFTLGLLDVLTPESLTGGQHIAATGTMDLNGVVGPVGGVHQKVVAARRAGATLMLVPSDELDEARLVAGDLRIEPADTLDQALAVLTTLGGGDAVLPPAPSTPAGP